MFTSKSLKFLLLSIFVVLFFSNKSQAGEPVPGAEILLEIELKGKTVIIPCFPKGGGDPLSGMNIPGGGGHNKPNVTGKNGESLFEIPSAQFKKLPDKFQLKFTIKPKEPTKYVLTKGATNTVIVNWKKSDGPKIKFILSWQENAPIKGRGGTATKTGGKYMGQVQHF